MTVAQLTAEIRRKQTFLCIGLDTDLDKIPAFLKNTEDPLFAFNKAIIDATHDLCVAYKPNTAFYEAYGSMGWMALERTIAYLEESYPNHFTIADAKRGDIGNTSGRYARAFFETMSFDSVTVAPYMGRDSVEPFLEFEDKYVILLALTSNEGAFDFQVLPAPQEALYLQVLRKTREYANADRLMYVVGATKATFLKDVREIVPNQFLLIPGVGAQGGSLEEVCKYGLNNQVGLLVNSSRGIIYASGEEDFAEAARIKAAQLQEQMSAILLNSKI
ncbi:orotidine-5'-phosphate decarboxylase [Robiginitalea aurantiaca]|uniref:Orotidine 5'-phosphate decarboxylase n=1 Tax=Robiginitalea aurantiaca TaxID=3056915 RepID=A0ABT7WD90_9FLAO|nr:orotidine-5'-phosphate decarboxylase [Robiginitalea aurantiaca]MDM9630863.1 orotidine-5'-phosphate decarboxylase [Robiginitalea aurantiaca]